MAEIKVLPSALKQILKEDDTGLELRIYYLECLAQATYIIKHEDVAFIVDPRRDVDAFLFDLNETKSTLKGILETHFHADFVSGHLELMQRTGAKIYVGPTAGPRCKFPHYELADQEIISFSSYYSIKVLHTPGHTPESIVYLIVKQNNNEPIMAFTGDTLFIGSCGRPDLVGSIGFTSEQMAHMMFDSLMNKICTLPSTVKVFPAHGAGSPCGKNLSSDLYSTIGKEKATNPALQFTNEEEFVKFLTEGQPVAPGYFAHDVQQNITGAKNLADELSKIPAVDSEEFKSLIDKGGHIIIDTRAPSEYNSGFIEGSLNFPLGEAGGAILRVEDGNFAMWIGTLLSSDAKILLISKVGKEGEALQRMARIGYTNVVAILKDGMETWKYPTSTTHRLNLKTNNVLPDLLSKGNWFIDVRTASEHSKNTTKEHTINLPLNEIYKNMNKLDKTLNYIAYCTSGYRSVIATSILRANGYNVVDIYGGFAAVSVYCSSLTTSEETCPSMKAMIEKLE